MVIRFGAIWNYGEVARFFSKIPAEDVHYLTEAPGSRPGCRIFEIAFDRTMDLPRIVAARVSVQRTETAEAPTEA